MTDAKERNPEDVQKMFARVSKRYDIANRAMTFGMDIRWRKILVGELFNSAKDAMGKSVIDAACGSGDVTLEILRQFPDTKVTATDFCQEMLDIAENKLAHSKFADKAKVKFLKADCTSMPLENESFDGATIAFGFRNFKNRPAVLRELFRILRAGSKIRMLETSRAGFPLEQMQNFFMGKVAPLAASLCGGTREDYEYLAKTTLEYPTVEIVNKMFSDAGFANVSNRKLAFGLVAITEAEKIF